MTCCLIASTQRVYSLRTSALTTSVVEKLHATQFRIRAIEPGQPLFDLTQ
jgi:hypothetical protein